MSGAPAPGQSAAPVQGNWIARLLRLASEPVERCELCGKLIPEEHEHLLEVERDEMVCACFACATMLGGQSEGRFRAVPPRAEKLDRFVMSESDWRSLEIPIGMAFLTRSSRDDAMLARYPGPGGVTVTSVPQQAWRAIAAKNPGFVLADDVEALLVNRIGARRDHYRLSIDRCFVLAALFRKYWSGFTGGDAVWEAVDAFFAGIGHSPARRLEAAHG
jgi:hypothetical protein